MSIHDTVDELIKQARKKIIDSKNTAPGVQEISGALGEELAKLEKDCVRDDTIIVSTMSRLYDVAVSGYSMAKREIDNAWASGMLGDPVGLLGYRDILDEADKKLRETIERFKPRREEVEKNILELETKIENEAKMQIHYDYQRRDLEKKLRQAIEDKNIYEGRPELTDGEFKTEIEKIEREVRGGEVRSEI
jgi:hypothetical protein